MSEDNIERDKIKVQLSNIESFLLKTGYLKSKSFTNNHFNILNQSHNNKDYLSHFEFNEKISFSEASVKYGILIQSINKIFKSNLSIDIMFEQYLDVTKEIISLNQYINTLILIELIITNFNEILINNDFIINLLNHKLMIYDISILDNKENQIKNKIEAIYKNLIEKPNLKGNQINGNIILLIYFISMGNAFFVDKNIPDLKKLMKYFTKYNNIYINNIDMIVFLYLYIIIIINIYINSNKHKKVYLKYENNNLLYFDLNENDNKLSDSIPTLYLYDNESIFYQSENTSIKILMFQNYLKYFSFFYLSKNKIKYTINLYIESFYDLLLHIYNYLKFEKNNNEKSQYNIESLENKIFENKTEANFSSWSKLNLSKINLLEKDNISLCFNTFNFLNLSIFMTGFQNDFQIARTIAINLELIKKSKKCYMQESSLLKEIKKDNESLTTIENLIDSFTILCNILENFGKNNHLKKSYLYLIIIKLNFFKCTINRDKKKQEIQIFYDYSNIKEKNLFNFLKNANNVLFLTSKYIEVVNLLPDFKQYNSVLRISQTNFLSQQLTFYFKIITKIIIDYIESIKNTKIEIYEKNLNNYNPNMLVYIKDDIINKKMRIGQIKQIINNPIHYQKIKIFQNFIEHLEENFDIIIISNNIKEFKLLRTFDDNKLFIYISKEIPNNLDEKKKNFEINSNSFYDIYEYLNIIMYFKNDQEIYRNGMKFLNLIKEAKKSQKVANSFLPFKTTLICDRFFLESKVIIEPSMKSSIQSVYDIIDNLLLIAKCINSDESFYNNESYNYDIYINPKFISVCNYHIYQYKNDNNYKSLIYNFLSVVSNCIELIIYLLKYKDMSINKFIYIIRTQDDAHFAFEFKNSNIFFKKIKEFDSLISLDVKKSYPLLCLLSNKKETEYMESNNNFYDLFLRLFLNLNKIADDKEKLIQLFLQKVHKSFFYQYYDSFILTGFTYEAINYFNDFFIVNDYLKISNGDKFDKLNIVPIHIMNQIEKKNYNILLEKYFNENKDKIMFNKISLINYNFDNSYIYKNFNNITMSFRKVEYYNNIQNAQINSDLKKELNKKKKYLYLKLYKRKDKKKIFENIFSFIKKGEFIGYVRNEQIYEDILSDYKKERIKYKSQNVEKRIFQMTENAKLDINSNNNDCIIY